MRHLIVLALVCCFFAKVRAEAPASLATDAPKLEAVAPPSDEEMSAALDRGIGFLLDHQNPDGSWGSARRTKDLNIYAPVPGSHQAFRAAVTSLCISSLCEAERYAGKKDERITAAIDRAEVWLFEHLPHVRRANVDAIYNVWAHGYSLPALVYLAERKPDDPAHLAKVKENVEQQLDLLSRYETVDGGWGYYDFKVGAKQPTCDSTSFVSGAILVAMHDLKRIGIEPPERLVKRAVESIQRQRRPDFAYLYGEQFKFRTGAGINDPGGSLGRSQCCNIALRLWGDEKVTNEIMSAWLDRLFARNGWLSIGRKRPVPHEAWFQVAGYFYYFGHYYGALCIEALPEAERAEFQSHMAHTLIGLQETDGSWWDYPFYDYHQPYGTAFALMTLYRCRNAPVSAEATASPSDG
jgi:hypothetical protein